MLIQKIVMLFVLLSSLLISSTSFATDWFLVGNTDDSKVYFLDVSSIQPTKDGLITAWVRVDLSKSKWQDLFKKSAKK